MPGPKDLRPRLRQGSSTSNKQWEPVSVTKTIPLLVSVRSGAAVSMPGMMDTVLNLGINDTAVEALAAKSGNARFAYDSYRLLLAGTVTVSLAACRLCTYQKKMMPSKTTKHQSADGSSKVTVPPANQFDVNTPRTLPLPPIFLSF